MPSLINPNSNTKLNPIGINLPIQRGSIGYFDQTFDTISQIKANIVNLLNTKRGERRFQPLLGGGIWGALFEQNLESNVEILKKIVINDINNWIPSVNVINVNLSVSSNENSELKDTYTVYIKVTFVINNTIDSVEVVLQQNRT
jgi:phage baseplate assembly protein W